MKTFIVFALFAVIATSAAPAGPSDNTEVEVKSPELPKALSKKLNRIANDVKAVSEEAASSDNDDIVAVINDIVNVLNTINGMNSIGHDSVDVVNTLTGFGEIDVVAGNTGETTKVQIGDLTNVIGKIQGTWFTNDVVDNEVGIDSNNGSADSKESDAQAMVSGLMKALNKALERSSV